VPSRLDVVVCAPPVAARPKVGVQPLGDLLGQPLLHLGTPGEQVDDPGELGQPEDPLPG
jgi:hypothetical protein